MKHLMDANDDNSLVGTCDLFDIEQYNKVRAKTGFLRIRFMSPSEVTCLLDDCCFSELALSRSNSACWPSIKQT
jgi:hypothetical protein